MGMGMASRYRIVITVRYAESQAPTFLTRFIPFITHGRREHQSTEAETTSPIVRQPASTAGRLS